MIDAKFKWELADTASSATIDNLEKRLGISKILATLLAQQGITSTEQAKKFFEPSIEAIAGPHRSLWGRVSVGFSSARGWLMPFYSGAATVWSPCDISGWRFEAAAGYSWRGIIDVQASVAMAPQKVDRGYYLWRDRAGIVADLSLALHPLRPLIVKADWQIRALRHGSVMFTDAKIAILGSDVFHALYPINNVSDLSLSASWQFTPAFSVWAEGANLLNRHCDTFTPFTSQGRTAMAGVTWRF